MALSPRSVAELIDAVQRHHLLGTALQEQLVMSLQSGFTEPAELAEDLVRRQHLTFFQAKQIFLGRAAELTIGPYVLLELLGQGSMGCVYKARHRRLERIDAVKIINREHLSSPLALYRFQQEAQATARLSHPNIVAIFDADQDGERRYLAMEYVEGDDLARTVRNWGPMPVSLTCDAIRQTALGLQHAGEQQLVHRDIKPSNLMVTNDHRWVKILDLGLALLHQTDPPNEMEAVAGLMGTPDYIAPEQAENPRTVDIRADIYSLGCTSYFLLTGQPPFPEGSHEEKVRRHQQDTPMPLERRRPRLPPELVRIVNRMMARRPEDRYQTPREIVADVDQAGFPAPRPADSAGSV